MPGLPYDTTVLRPSNVQFPVNVSDQADPAVAQ